MRFSSHPCFFALSGFVLLVLFCWFCFVNSVLAVSDQVLDWELRARN